MSKHDYLTLIIQILMAVFGSAARILNQKGNLREASVFASLFISAFTGMTLYWIAQAMALDAAWMYAMSGIAGWAGPQALEGILKMVQRRTGVPLSGDDSGNSSNSNKSNDSNNKED